MSALDIVYSLPFLLGAIVGLILDRIIKCAEAKWLDKHEPLPDGTKHRPAGYSRTYVAALVAAAVLGYVLLSVARSEMHYKGLAGELVACQKINAENDRLSLDQRKLFLELDKAESAWLGRLLTPPPDIADLSVTDPRRQAWIVDVSRVYQDRAGELVSQIVEISRQQEALDADRAANPTCGAEPRGR